MRRVRHNAPYDAGNGPTPPYSSIHSPDICHRLFDGYGGSPVLQIGRGMPAPLHSPPLPSRWPCGASVCPSQHQPELLKGSSYRFAINLLSGIGGMIRSSTTEGRLAGSPHCFRGSTSIQLARTQMP
jgi:hypothetical protein